MSQKLPFPAPDSSRLFDVTKPSGQDLAMSTVDQSINQRRHSTAESGSADEIGICLVLPPSRLRRERQVNARTLSSLLPAGLLRMVYHGEWVADFAGVDPVLTTGKWYN
jgi:hypothetical protein